ncbi:hypothetical protein [uncultured Paraglaciecola sp.]|uniref:hypothetical protein n=1 Tax=uncultured Paraglaciecola sp. TaxID=1765024 RepID=UPI0026154306|nr:hypothetical protein [uncultured Paraglaciecola sp.]
MNVYLDIETVPQQPEDEAKAIIEQDVKPPKTMSKPETIQAWMNGDGKYAGEKEKVIEESYRKTSLDGAKGEVISIAFAVNDLVFSRCRELGEPESDLLNLFADAIQSHTNKRPPYFVGHNIQFDLKFLFHRCVIREIKTGFALPFGGRHGNNFYCTMQAWAGFNGRISQDNLCKALGIEGKPSDIDGSKVWDFVKAGDVKRVNEYNVDDVRKVKAIYDRINSVRAD